MLPFLQKGCNEVAAAQAKTQERAVPFENAGAKRLFNANNTRAGLKTAAIGQRTSEA